MHHVSASHHSRIFARVLPWLIAAFAAGCTLDAEGTGELVVTCGNEFLDPHEECDGDLTRGETCLDFDFTHGEVKCVQCRIDSSECHTCGNDIREGTEDCDGGDLGGETCKTAAGFETGILSCTAQCRWDATRCATCGNGNVEEGEACDAYVDSKHTCESIANLEAGQLLCTASCTIDSSMCFTCGNGVVEGPERCDGDDLAGMDCAKLGQGVGTLGCSDDCAFDTTGCSDPPDDWYDTGGPFRRQIVVDKDLVDSELFEFPLLVALTDPHILDNATSAQDFVFTDVDGTTILPWEIERYDETTGALLTWVRVPALISAIDTKLFVYYGNPSPPPPPALGVVWTNGFVGVWHLNDTAVDESSGALHVDAVTGMHPGTQSGNHDVEGKIGRAQSFDGADDFMEFVGPAAFMLGDTDCTVSAWIRFAPTAATDTAGLLRKGSVASSAPGDKQIGLNAGHFAVDHGGIGMLEGEEIKDSDWHHVVWTQRRNVSQQIDEWVLFVDGVPSPPASFTTLLDVPGHVLRIGQGVAGSAFPTGFEGDVDELRIDRVARSAAWVSACYLNQYAPEGFFTLGPVQSLGSL